MGEIRLTCPECGAEYRVDATAIPADGRDVECSSCGHGWHQPGAMAPKGTIPTATEAGPRLNRPLPDSVLSVLREEAELARRQRGEAAEPEEATVILTTDPPMAGPAPSRHINDRPQRPGDSAPAQNQLEATVNRTTPHGHARTVNPLHEEESGAKDRAGYLRGVALSLAGAASLLLAYVLTPDTGGQGGLAGFRVAVDDGRAWLHQSVFGTGGE
ncbi:zinc-ribbon domain-containing protein [uncultured Paracoccus sp.]|uniref:zinc-ribbon domain-containing protein n=1 Tax=uncultured Paracoccus sp. TaxID=189685 RepID=UPI002603D547|nr:zinc-ribbon domain-containing protein [uncultured Paracoccus sp.]